LAVSKGRRHKRKQEVKAAQKARTAEKAKGLQKMYERACELVEQGQPEQARRLYETLETAAQDPRLCALVANDLGALAALGGDLASARAGFQKALIINEGCGPARDNLALLDEEEVEKTTEPETLRIPLAPVRGPPSGPALEDVRAEDSVAHSLRECPSTRGASGLHSTLPAGEPDAPVKVAIVSFLFNWPSTGGGIVHTVELGKFLAKAGYTVRHFYARYRDLIWDIGAVSRPCPSTANPWTSCPRIGSCAPSRPAFARRWTASTPIT
jgi:hypothetical protein